MSTKAPKKDTVKSIVSPGNFIAVSVGDETYQITRDNKNFAKIEVLVKAKKWDEVFNILGAAKVIEVYTEGNIKIEGGIITYKGKQVDNYAAEKLVKMISEGASDFRPLMRFMDKLFQNPDSRVHEHLYRFLEYGGVPITPDGDFLGYKRVRSNYMDSHSGTLLNKPGHVVRMPREKVVADPAQACQSGLHVGVRQYVDGFIGDRTVIVKVDPRNVVSVPFDYGHQKMRTCEYYVVADFDPNVPLTSEVYNVVQTDVPEPEVEIEDIVPVTKDAAVSEKVTNKKVKVEKYVAANVGPLRGPDGRFIKRSAAPVKKGPLRGPDGRFIKRK